MGTLADGISFVAASAGTGTFVFAASRTSYLTLASAQSAGFISDGATVSYLALDSLVNPTQREWGHGTYSLAGNSVARTTVLGNHGATTSLVNFGVAPTVFLTALAEDFILLPAAGNLTWFVSTTGSDSNNGLTSGTAFLTLQHALNVAKQYDYQGLYVPTINVGSGTFNSASEIYLPQLVGIRFDVNTGGGQIVGAGAASTTLALTGAGLAIFRAQGTNCAWNFQSIGFNAASSWVFDTVGACNITSFGGTGLQFNGTNYAIVIGNGGTVHWIGQAVNFLGGMGNFGNLFFNTNFIMHTCTFTWPPGHVYPGGDNEDINNYSSLQMTSNTFVNTPSGSGITANTYGSFVSDNGLTSDYPSTGSNFFSFDDTSSIINNGTSVTSFGHNGLAGIPTTSNISPGFWSVWKDNTGGGVYVVYNDAGTIKKVQLV